MVTGTRCHGLLDRAEGDGECRITLASRHPPVMLAHAERAMYVKSLSENLWT